ncbi:uncharacterized protein LOC128984829 [Macrosteles quadrilineatus]|uniref:uncharacterized protein LOC128984829 n=1 Tax=Macrosteles quadrilineatus TaxID=74068 RepID=UPI0023E127CE|nr:uncharacterized protein LOC128984829 [Macrosteles quadrilineatus]
MVLQIVIVIKVLLNYYVQKERWSTFDSAVTHLMNASILITVSHGVLFTWKNSQRIANALNNWKFLQNSFQSVTSKRISSWLLDHPYLGISIPTFYLIIIEYTPVILYYILQTNMNRRSGVVTYFAYFCATWYIKLVLWFWLIFTHSVSQASQILKISFAEMMAGDPTVSRLRLHRTLWLELHNYTCAVTAAVGNTVRAWLFNLVMSFYFSIYACSMSFANGTNKTSTIIPLLARGLQAFLVNNATSRAESQMSEDFILKILSFNFSEFTQDQLEEIELFLYTIENSSGRFSLEHMVEPSRQTILDVSRTYVLRTSFTSKRGWSGFDSTIQTLMNLSLLTTVPQSILLTWRKSGNIASAINQWKTFQKTFQEVTRRSISSFPLEHPNWTVFLIAFCSSLTDFIPATISYQRTVKDQFKIHVFVVYGATVLYVKMILAIWLMHTHSVSLAAKLLKDSLVEMLAGDPTVIKLRLHRSLWVELHNYTCAVTAAVGNTVRAWLMTNILTASLSVYATGISFTNNEPLKVSTYTPIITCALPVFLINNASFMADDQTVKKKTDAQIG